jgi:flagellar P-ring protein precursor FlgI
MRLVKFVLVPLTAAVAFAGQITRTPVSSQAKIRDIAIVEGVRDNALVGYGVVVGLNGTGDKRQTMFTIQTLANAMQRMGVQVPVTTARVNNIAAVFVTATLPAFAVPGTHLDVTVSSIGDAKSLQGGVLLLTPLQGADGNVYAAAQGGLTLGGYVAGTGANGKVINHPTVGRIPEGAIVERPQPLDLKKIAPLHIILREPSFTRATAVADAINAEWRAQVASAQDGRSVVLATDKMNMELPSLLARVENLRVPVDAAAKVVVNERTGTIIMGHEVTLGAVSIMHGNLAIEIKTEFRVSQPESITNGKTTVVPDQDVRVKEGPARKLELAEGATVEQLVGGLQSIGATAHDVIAILQALKRAGAIQAELEVL